MPFPVAPYESCSFCLDLSGERECAFVVKNDLAAALVDERQYERGAMLVIPRQHRETILDIGDEELAAIAALTKKISGAAERAYGDNGLKASQHEPHFHVHVVPKYTDSESEKLFLQRNYDVIPIEEQREIARILSDALRR